MSTQELPITENMSSGRNTSLTAFLRAVLSSAADKARRYLAESIRARAIRQAENELTDLDDRMLRDIGLTRSEIPSAIRHAEQNFLHAAQPR